MATADRLLDDRRRELRASLRRIEQTLEQLPANGRSIEWIERLRPIVVAEVARLTEQLENVVGDVSRRFAEMCRIERLTERVATEALAFVGGITARAAGIDEGLCDRADALLGVVGGQILQGYRPVVIPSGTEFIDVFSEVIRLRYPGEGIWDLPIALHEYGHFLVPRLTHDGVQSVYPVISHQRSLAYYLGSFAEELWADTFATYCGGPAYAFRAFSRFDAGTAHVDELPSHPSPLRRSAAIFATLNHLQEAWRRTGRAAGSLEKPIELIDTLWRERLDAVGPSPVGANPTPRGTTPKQEEQREHATALAKEFIAILDRDLTAVRYDDARAAVVVRDCLQAEDPEPIANQGLVQLLNGAWWTRASAHFGLNMIDLDKTAARVRAMFEQWS